MTAMWLLLLVGLAAAVAWLIWIASASGLGMRSQGPDDVPDGATDSRARPSGIGMLSFRPTASRRLPAGYPDSCGVRLFPVDFAKLDALDGARLFCSAEELCVFCEGGMPGGDFPGVFLMVAHGGLRTAVVGSDAVMQSALSLLSRRDRWRWDGFGVVVVRAREGEGSAGCKVRVKALLGTPPARGRRIEDDSSDEQAVAEAAEVAEREEERRSRGEEATFLAEVSHVRQERPEPEPEAEGPSEPERERPERFVGRLPYRYVGCGDPELEWVTDVRGQSSVEMFASWEDFVRRTEHVRSAGWEFRRDFEGCYVLYDMVTNRCFVGGSETVRADIASHFAPDAPGFDPRDPVTRAHRAGDAFQVQTMTFGGSGFDDMATMRRFYELTTGAATRGYNRRLRS